MRGEVGDPLAYLFNGTIERDLDDAERKPALLAASRGTMVVIEGDPMLQASSWLSLLVAFNAIHWSLSGLFFGRVLEDG